MGQIIKEIILVGSKNKHKKLKALFDTGAQRNFISKTFSDSETIYDIGVVEYLGEDTIILPEGSQHIGQIIKLNTLIINDVEKIQPKFFLWDMKMCDVIIGAKLMQELKIILDPSTKKISFG